MRLWHILSKERYDQKLLYARHNHGQLLIETPSANKDISNGALGKFLHCLPTLAGGACFSDASALRAIRIDLTSDADILKFKGNPDDLNFQQLLNGCDGIDMQIEVSRNWPVRFRQILLWNPNIILDWTAEPSVVAKHFFEEFHQLRAHWTRVSILPSG